MYKTKTDSAIDWKSVVSGDMYPLAGNRIKLRMMLNKICFDVYGNEGDVAVTGLI